MKFRIVKYTGQVIRNGLTLDEANEFKSCLSHAFFVEVET